MTRHFGIFQFKDNTSQEEIDECFAQLAGLKDCIPGILSVEHGPYNSDEGFNDGFTHGFIMTFENAEARDNYLPHPEHVRVAEYVQPRLERFTVFDFDV